MCDEDKCDPGLLLNPLELDTHRLPELEVECREWLVQKQDLWMRRQCTRNGDPLLLPSRQLAGLAVAEFPELHQFKHLACPYLCFLLFFTLHLQAERDVVHYGHMWKQSVMLKDGVDLALVRWQADDLFTEQTNRAFGDVLEPGDHLQEGRLAAARGAEQREELGVVDCQVDLVQGDEATIGWAINLAPLSDVDGNAVIGCLLRHVFRRYAYHGPMRWILSQGK